MRRQPAADDAAPDPGTPRDAATSPGLSRRGFVGAVVTGAVGTAAGAVGGYALGRAAGAHADDPDADAAREPEVVDPYGEHQAGIHAPVTPQLHAHTVVLDLARVDGTALRSDLASLGETIARLARGEHPGLLGLAPARLTVTVGLGPGLVRDVLGAGAGADDLPAFVRDDLTPARSGGDLALMIRADDAAVVALALGVLRSLPALAGATPRWDAAGFRGPAAGPSHRSLIGFHDGLSLPEPDELDAAVWLAESDRPGFAGATIAVVRVMPIDTAAFSALTVAQQEAVVGRSRASGAPLSGGSARTAPDLGAKDDTGRYAIPVDAHVRRAHPLPAGLDALMLRRSYSYSAEPDDQGLVFVSFQRDLDTFVRTQRRLDDADALTALARTTASGTFLLLPGYSPRSPLGAAIGA